MAPDRRPDRQPRHPAGKDLLDAASEQLGPERFHLLPTLCWLDAGDAFLHGLCAAGVVLALLVVAGWLEVPALCGCGQPPPNAEPAASGASR